MTVVTEEQRDLIINLCGKCFDIMENVPIDVQCGVFCGLLLGATRELRRETDGAQKVADLIISFVSTLQEHNIMDCSIVELGKNDIIN